MEVKKDAESENELEGEESDSHVSDTTLELGEPVPAKGSSTGGLREIQWSVIHEEQIKLKKKHPSWSAKEVLKAAREACLGCIKIKNENIVKEIYHNLS